MDADTLAYYTRNAAPRAELWESVDSPLATLLPFREEAIARHPQLADRIVNTTVEQYAPHGSSPKWWTILIVSDL